MKTTHKHKMSSKCRKGKEECCPEGEKLTEEGRKRLEHAIESIERGKIKTFRDADEMIAYLHS